MNQTKTFKRWVAAFLLLLAFFIAIEKSYSVSASFEKRDDVITAQLQAKIAADPELARFYVNVNTVKHIVTLSGTVNTLAEANKLVMLANAIAGVKSVDASHLAVRKVATGAAKALSSDNIINSQVIGLYMREGLIDSQNPARSDIHVVTQHGVVYVSGSLESAALANNAVKLAESINGVTKVVSTIKTP